MGKKFKLLAALSLVLMLMAQLLTGCGSTGTKDAATADKKQIKVGFAQKTLENEFQKALADGVVKAGEAKGWKVTVLDAKNSIENEQKNMETFVAQKYDLIFINVVDTKAATESINAAVKAGIPVIGIDSHVDEAANVVTGVSAPDLANGRVVGLFAAKQYDKSEMISAALLSGNKGNPGGQARRKGLFAGIIEGRTGCTEKEAWALADKFEQELTDNGKAVNNEAKFAVVTQGWGNWTVNGGLPAMEDILVANSKINCVLGENDSMLIGAKQAIDNRSLTGIKIFAAADAMKGALELIKGGSAYQATGLNNPKLVGAKGIDIAEKVLVEHVDPKSFGKTVTTDPVCVTAENVDKFYDPNAIF
ncbi:substrate-binding domain-containing protein [Propionispora hippei]|uniref:Ribose transport system substrate-binding protein n=1 Tax=Propionispora hippei DSM 15287 TaxID=1123003 RepID=A0A1M6I100_9FIRM|nr:substrate-binding domain-containing protein [Propionispora hippei]SHJ28101.1 ribose transport system substrate-binding protein [Propionispora hippei DSM 15287]